MTPGRRGEGELESAGPVSRATEWDWSADESDERGRRCLNMEELRGGSLGIGVSRANLLTFPD